MTRIVGTGKLPFARVQCDHLFDKRHRDDGHERFCQEEFRTATPRMLAEQLRAARWTTRETPRDGLMDFCPAHPQPHVTMEQRYSMPRESWPADGKRKGGSH